MKINYIKLICPKCKKEYENKELVSFHSKFIKSAKNFIKENKTITKCKDCKLDLIKPEYAKYFDENGELNFGDWKASLFGISLRNFIIYDLYDLKNLLPDFKAQKLILDGYVEVVDEKINNEENGEDFLHYKNV